MNIYTYVLFVVYLIYFLTLNFFYIALLLLAVFGSVRRFFEEKYADFDLVARSNLTIPISIIIAAYNEEGGIINVLYSSLNSIYPEFEVILVNDGSTDGTLATVDREFDLQTVDAFYRQPLETKKVRRVYRSRRNQNLWVIDKENGGKADALNAGVNLSHYRYVAMTDADSIFQPWGLLRIIQTVNYDPGRIIGVGGQIRVGNGLVVEKGKLVKKRLPKTLAARFQVIEYLGSFLGNRVGWSELNAIVVISGDFGLWRKDVFTDIGGMTSETTHEDIEFTFRVHERFRSNRIPYRLIFLPDPIVWTEVPDTWRGLFSQRRRWQRVVIEVFWKYRRMFLNPRYGTFGLIAMPYLLVYEILGPFFELSSYAIVFTSLFLGLLSLNLFLLFLLVSFGLTSIVRIASVFVEQFSFRTFSMWSLTKLLFVALFENLGYHQYISVARIAAFFDFLRKKKSWERIRRKGFT